MELKPLQQSAEFDNLEAQFKALFLSLYRKRLSGQLDEAASLGMPHLGPDSLISRELNNDGLALMSDTTDARTRMLFNAWRYLNPQRGTAFLQTYLTALFGNVFSIDQLWCPVNGTYPKDAISETEVQTLGHSLNNYFLTSRVRVDIDTLIVPTRVLMAARTAVPARIVLEIRVAKRVRFDLGVGMAASSAKVGRTPFRRSMQTHLL